MIILEFAARRITQNFPPPVLECECSEDLRNQ
jgi:hypothetical protein